MLSRGPPRRHHIVAYLLLRSQEPHEELEVSPLLIPFFSFFSFFFLFFLAPPDPRFGFQARICPSEAEVSAYAWLEPRVLEAIAATEDGAGGPGCVPSTLPASIR